MEQCAWRTDPRFALEIMGDLVGDDQSEGSLGVGQLYDRLTRVLQILAAQRGGFARPRSSQR